MVIFNWTDIFCEESVFVVSPVNKFLMLDEGITEVQFNCEIQRSEFDFSTNWVIENPGNDVIQISANQGIMHLPDKFSIDGEHNLVITNVEAADALFYGCENALSGTAHIITYVYLLMIGNIIKY